MSVDQRKLDQQAELSAAMSELDLLTKGSRTLNQTQRLRVSALLSKISYLKAGGDVDSYNREELRKRELAMGKLPTEFSGSLMTPERRAYVESWIRFAKGREKRDVEGDPIARIGSYNSAGGTFIPTEFFRERLPMMLKTHSPLFDPDSVSYVETTHGRPLLVPYLSDTQNVAQLVSESADESSNEADIFNPNHAVLTGYSYRSPLWRISLEAFEDVESADGAIGLFEQFVAQRIALGVGHDLLLGTGVAQPAGLLPSLLAAGIVPITAAGSAENTGGSEDGTNTVGSRDLAKLYYSVDKLYRNSPKCAWLMNDNTLKYIASLIDKVGKPLINLDQPTEIRLMGRPVKVDLNMPDLAGSKQPIVFGDFSYFFVRSAHSIEYIRNYWQAPNLVANGLMAFRAFCRYDSALAYNGVGRSPFAVLQMHS